MFFVNQYVMYCVGLHQNHRRLRRRDKGTNVDACTAAGIGHDHPVATEKARLVCATINLVVDVHDDVGSAWKTGVSETLDFVS